MITDKKPLLTVVVPLYNGSEIIESCLRAIRSQEGFHDGEIEIIVVDDGSSDGGAEKAREHADVLVRFEENRGAAFARNAGAAVATADIIVFVDSDVFAESHALAAFLDLFRDDSQVDAAVGRYTEQPAAPGLVNVYHNAFTRFHHDLSPTDIDWFWGALGSVRKEAFFEAGGFDERYEGASAEDMELGKTLAQDGRRIRYLPKAEGAHAHDFTFGSMLENDYKKSVLGMKLMLMGRLPKKAPDFGRANLVSIIMLALFFVLVIAGLLPVSLLLLIFMIVRFMYLTDLGISLGRISPGIPMLAVALLYYVQMCVMTLGAVAGAVGHAIGRTPYGKPGWI